jgi:hypothetical protein
VELRADGRRRGCDTLLQFQEGIIEPNPLRVIDIDRRPVPVDEGLEALDAFQLGDGALDGNGRMLFDIGGV